MTCTVCGTLSLKASIEHASFDSSFDTWTSCAPNACLSNLKEKIRFSVFAAGCYFCWLCNKRVDGYEHFRNQQCILFDEQEIALWNLQHQDFDPG